MKKIKPYLRYIVLLYSLLLCGTIIHAAGSSDFFISVAGKDSNTQTTSTQVGNDINWVINYDNLGPSSNNASIYYPVESKQGFKVGSITTPAGWSILYSEDTNCNDSSFTYTPSVATGEIDTNIKCIKFASQNAIPSVASSSEPITLTTTPITFSGDINNYGTGDVFKVTGYQNKIYAFEHHSRSDQLNNREEKAPGEIFTCFDPAINQNCISRNPNITYPVALGFAGLSPADQAAVNIPTTATSVVIGNKLYFPYDDFSGGGIMCWDLDTDTYCNGGDLNARGQIQLDNIDMTQSDGYTGSMPQGTTFDIVYDSASSQLFSVISDGTIVCYQIDVGPCSGQPYNISLTPRNTDYGGWSRKANGGIVELVNNKIYATLTVPQEFNEVGCLDLSTRTKCANWASPKRPEDPYGYSYYLSLFNMNNQLCVIVNAPADYPDEPYIKCYNESTDKFDLHFRNSGNTIDSTMLTNNWYMRSQNSPDNKIYFLGWDNANVYCFDKSSENVCAGWDMSGRAIASNSEWRAYSLTYYNGCLFITADSGHIYSLDPNTWGTCNIGTPGAKGTTGLSLDASSYYCSTPATNVGWNKITLNDTNTNKPVVLTASVYDTVNCTNSTTCTGSPVKYGNFTETANGFEFNLSDISYADHKNLTAVVDYIYLAAPDTAPLLKMSLNPSFKPEICLQTKVLTDGIIASSPSIVYSEDSNDSNNTSFSTLSTPEDVPPVSYPDPAPTPVPVPTLLPDLTSYPVSYADLAVLPQNTGVGSNGTTYQDPGPQVLGASTSRNSLTNTGISMNISVISMLIFTITGAIIFKKKYYI